MQKLVTIFEPWKKTCEQLSADQKAIQINKEVLSEDITNEKGESSADFNIYHR